MVLAVHPSVADQLIGVVVVVQALKLKLGYHGVIMHCVCMWVRMCGGGDAYCDNLPFFACCPKAELSGCCVVGVAVLFVGDCCCDGSLSLTGDGWLLFCTYTKQVYQLN